MAMNLAKKYSSKVSERVYRDAIVGKITNKNYDWTGVDTIYLYSVDTFPMNDYRRSGENRYGTPSELGNTKQTWQLEQDSSFTGTVDKLNNAQTGGVMSAPSILARQVREEVVPEIDTYVLSVIGAAGATYNRDDIVTDAATTKDNAYTNILDMQANISDNDGKTTGLVAVMTAAYYNFLKQSGFVVDSDGAYKDRKTGNYGNVEGMVIELRPSSQMPTNTDLIVTHKEVTTYADVLTDYTTHNNPQGVSGVLIEGRVAYDAFVDVNKIYDVAIHKTA